jgi:bifunctional non-homologous end joining protein LigD
MTRPRRQVAAGARSADGRLQVTNLDKVLWPRDGYTKGDLIAYYRAVATWLCRTCGSNPLTLERYPNGIDEAGWWEKHIPRGLPDWVRPVKTAASTRHEQIEFMICNDEATLAYVANLAAVVLHVWYSHEPTLDTPDFILIDLDPGRGLHACDAGGSRSRRDELAGVGLTPLVKTTGGSGLHVVVPLEPRYDWEQAKAFAELVARRIHDVLPDHTTLDRTIARRPKGPSTSTTCRSARARPTSPRSASGRATAPRCRCRSPGARSRRCGASAPRTTGPR